MTDLTMGAWTLLAIAALIVGISKAALPGASTLSVAIFAAILPAKQSTATLLVLLIVGDILGISSAGAGGKPALPAPSRARRGLCVVSTSGV